MNKLSTTGVLITKVSSMIIIDGNMQLFEESINKDYSMVDIYASLMKFPFW